MSDNTGDLIAACRRGDRAAQRQLYEQYRDVVHRLMTRMAGPQEAPDLVQQVFVRVLTSLDQFAGRSRFETWLYRVSVNEALQHLRRRKRRKTCELTCDVAVASSAAGQCEASELLEQAIASLDPELRGVFLLREVEELPYHEIALVLNIHEGTVGSRLSRARRLLRERLIELGWQP